MDCGLKEEISELWTLGGSQRIVNFRYESVHCGLEAGDSGF